MSDLIEAHSATAERPRILIIDDDQKDRADIGEYAESLGYQPKDACTVEDAKLRISEAEENKIPFTLATIDRNFETGQQKGGRFREKSILRYIKSNYPYIACIMITGEPVRPDEVLDLRDDYDLDYYLEKARLDEDTFAKAVKRAVARVRPLGSTDRRREVLQKTLEKRKDIYAICLGNLASAEKKKALQGMNVGVDVENEIKLYSTQLREAEDMVRATEEEIKRLG